MPRYEITGPDGARYEVTAPEGASEKDILSFVQKNTAAPAGEDFAAKATALSPVDLFNARVKNDAFGNYLREQAKQRQPGETDEAMNKRLYGDLGYKKPGMLEGLARSMNQGLLMGRGDEVQAGINATLDPYLRDNGGMGGSWNDRYETYKANERGRLGQFRESNPVAATAAEVAGAIPTALAIPMGAATSVAGRLALGAGSGALQGAVYGYNAGDEDRLASAGLGAATGAVGGAAVPAVGSAIRAGAERVIANRAAGAAGMSRPAYQLMERTMGADDSLSGAGAQRMQAAGPGAMLADAGPNAQSMLDTIIQRSGPGGREALTAVESRAGQAGQQITQALDHTFGAPVGVSTTERGIRTGSQPARSASYRAAYAQPINYASPEGQQIERLITDRVPGDAIRRANALMRAEGESSNQILANIAEDGTVTFRRMPDVRQIDYITRGLKEVADQADGQGKLGGQTQLGRAYGNLSRELRDLTRTMIPEYGTALDTAAEPIAARNALRFGQEVLSARTTRDDVAQEIAGMSQAERQRVGQGIRAQIDDTLANVRRAVTDPNMDAREAVKAVKDLSSRAAREKVALVAGDFTADQLFGQLDQAARALELRASVATNSRTFARQSMNETMQSMTDDGVVNALRSGEPVNATKRLAQWLMGRTPADKTRIRDDLDMEVARMLTGPNGQQILQALTRYNGVPAAEAARIGQAAEAMLRRNPAVTMPILENQMR